MTTAGVIGVLTVILFLAVRKLNRRLKPILLQCRQLPHADRHALVDWQQQDELDQLSLAFFTILEQFNTHEETIPRCEQALAQDSRHVDQVREQFWELTTYIDGEANEQQILIESVQRLLADTKYQSTDIQSEALLTMGRALDGDLKRMAAEINSSQLLATMEQHMGELSAAIDTGSQPQLQSLVDQLTNDVANFKAYDRWQPSLKKLQFQASNIVRTGQAAVDKSRKMMGVGQLIAESLVKIGAITHTLNKQVKFASDMLWIDLEQRKDVVAHKAHRNRLNNR